MRHRVKGRKLGRTTPHRKATLRALSSALIREHRIETTVAKAKELRTFVEPLITRAKVDNTHNRRQVYSYLQDKVAVTELFETVGPAAADRPGGYTRVLKLGFRVGDAAEMAVIELVDFNDVQPEGKDSKKKKTRRAGKSSKSEETKAAPKSKKGAGKSAAAKKAAVEEVEATEVEEAEAKVEEAVDKVDEAVEKVDEAVVDLDDAVAEKEEAAAKKEEEEATAEVETETAEPTAEKTEKKETEKESDEVVAKEEDKAAEEDDEEEKK